MKKFKKIIMIGIFAILLVPSFANVKSITTINNQHFTQDGK